MLITAGGLTYEAPDDTKVGDTVVLPPTPYMSGSWQAEVSEAPARNPYRGVCKKILRNLGSKQEMREAEIENLLEQRKAINARLKELRAMA